MLFTVARLALGLGALVVFVGFSIAAVLAAMAEGIEFFPALIYVAGAVIAGLLLASSVIPGAVASYLPGNVHPVALVASLLSALALAATIIVYFLSRAGDAA